MAATVANKTILLGGNKEVFKWWWHSNRPPGVLAGNWIRDFKARLALTGREVVAPGEREARKDPVVAFPLP